MDRSDVVKNFWDLDATLNLIQPNISNIGKQSEWEEWKAFDLELIEEQITGFIGIIAKKVLEIGEEITDVQRDRTIATVQGLRNRFKELSLGNCELQKGVWGEAMDILTQFEFTWFTGMSEFEAYFQEEAFVSQWSSIKLRVLFSSLADIQSHESRKVAVVKKLLNFLEYHSCEWDKTTIHAFSKDIVWPVRNWKSRREILELFHKIPSISRMPVQAKSVLPYNLRLQERAERIQPIPSWLGKMAMRLWERTTETRG